MLKILLIHDSHDEGNRTFLNELCSPDFSEYKENLNMHCVYPPSATTDDKMLRLKDNRRVQDTKKELYTQDWNARLEETPLIDWACVCVCVCCPFTDSSAIRHDA